MGLYAPRAIHQASDSMSYVMKARQILDGSYDRKKRKRPWALQKDGDLWEHFYKAAQAKGRESIKISWTKGHATLTHIQQGTTTSYLKEGNDKVDQIANRGIQEGYDEGMYDLAGYFARQREELKNVIIRLQKATLRVLKAEHKERVGEEERKLREQRALYGKDAGKVCLPSEYPFALDAHAEGACSIEITRPCSGELDNQEKDIVFSIFAFIRNSLWVPTSGATNGTSWVELFAAFYIGGGRTLKEDFQKPDYYEASSMIPSYREFRRIFMQVVRMWVHPDFRFLFAPARVGKARLERYGVISHLSCIKAERVTNSVMAKEIHRAMASLTVRYSRTNAENLGKGILKV